MNGKFIFASILVASSAAVFGQMASRTALDKATPLLYRCSVTPAPDRMAINTKGTGTSSGRTATGAMTAASDRIDLEFAMTRPSRGQTSPTISGHAINTKGTGATTGRMSGRPRSVVAVRCAGAVPAGGEGVEKVSVQDMSMRRGTLQGPAPEFSCSVSGTVKRPQFVIGIWTGVTASDAAKRDWWPKGTKMPPQGRAEWSWGVSNSSQRVSIVRYEWDRDSDVPRVACSSETPAMRGTWDLAVLKKA